MYGRRFTKRLTAMQVPPKIAFHGAREIPIEVLPPEGSRASSGGIQEPPIHALAALNLIAVDALWTIFDLAPPTWPLAIPACFLAVFIPVFLIQRHVKGDSKGRAAAFAALLGVLAAIPTPIIGTEAGLGLLLWTGLGKIFKRSLPGAQR